MKELVQKIYEIAQSYPDGFTVYIPSLEPVKNGWCIANRATQNHFGIDGLEKVVAFAMKHNRIVGGWQEGRNFYFDATIVEPDEQIAISMMILHNQKSIYNLGNMKYIKNQGYKE